MGGDRTRPRKGPQGQKKLRWMLFRNVATDYLHHILMCVRFEDHRPGHVEGGADSLVLGENKRE